MGVIEQELQMCRSCDLQINRIWPELEVGQNYETPDNEVRVQFMIERVEASGIDIRPQGIRISRGAFAAALHYLASNAHDARNPCPIESNNDPELSGPLCSVAREQNANVRCINYIVPVLSQHGSLAFSGTRPNTAWVSGPRE